MGRGERREGVKVKKILYKGVCVEVNAARQRQGRVKRPSKPASKPSLSGFFFPHRFILKIGIIFSTKLY